jgi:hypothetical protein
VVSRDARWARKVGPTTCGAAVCPTIREGRSAQRLEFRHSRRRAAGTNRLVQQTPEWQTADDPNTWDWIAGFGRSRLARGQGDRFVSGTPRAYREGGS